MTIEFGKRLSEYIKGSENTKNQADLARKLGLSSPQVSRMASGNQNARAEDAVTMIKELSVPQEEQAVFLLSAVGYPEDVIQEVTQYAQSRNSVILLPNNDQQLLRIEISLGKNAQPRKKIE